MITGLSDLHRQIPGSRGTDIRILLFMVAVLCNIVKNQWSLDEMVDWERGAISEQTPMIIEELNKLSERYDFVLFEGMIDINYLLSVTDRNRIA